MSPRAYFRIALLLPIAMPFALEPVRSLAPESVAGWLALPGVGLVIGGLPYAAFVLATLLYLRGRQERAYRIYALASPLIFAALLFLLVLGLSLFTAEALDVGTLLFAPAYIAAFGIGLGYFYVLLAFVGLWALQRAQLVKAAA